MESRAWLKAFDGDNLQVTLNTLTGTVLHVHASRETIEGYYGDVNQLVAKWLKPLDQVERITVKVFDTILKEHIEVVTFDYRLEKWIEHNTYVRITHRYYEHVSADVEEGFLSRVPGWLPMYGLRIKVDAETVEPIFTDYIYTMEPLYSEPPTSDIA